MESKIKEHFDDYKGAIEALKAFVSAIVWKSNDIEEGASEEEIAAHIEEYVHEQGEDLLSSLHQQIMEYMWTIYSRSHQYRYKVSFYECIGGGEPFHIASQSYEDLMTAINNAAHFYRIGTNPYVVVYDDEEKKNVIEWK